MRDKRYLLIRIIGVIIMAILGVTAAITGNAWALIPLAIIIGVVIYLFIRKVNEVVVDERINTIAYMASRLAFITFLILAVISWVILISLSRDGSPDFLPLS